MSAFKCKMCGGTLEINKDYATATCEYCGRQTVLTDEMKAYAAKLKTDDEHRQQQKQQAQREEHSRKEQIDAEKEARANAFRNGKSSKVLLVMMLFTLVGGINLISDDEFLKGIVVLVSAALYVLSYLLGMQIIPEKRKHLHVLVAWLAVIVLFLSQGIDNVTLVRSDWPSVGKKTSPSIATVTETDAEEGIYVYPVRNYVGKNLASCGHLSEERLEDDYGSGYVKLAIVTPNGEYVDVTNEKKIKNYIVIGQSIEPNNNLVVVHQRDSDGDPYSNLVDYQSHEEIILYVCDIDDVDENIFEQSNVTLIKGSPDRRTYFVRDYSGRNAASFGREWDDGRIDEYGDSELRITFTADDGTYVNPADESQLQKYVVTGQDIAPNTELKYVYQTNSRGEEYDNLIQSQNYEEINLYVTRNK